MQTEPDHATLPEPDDYSRRKFSDSPTPSIDMLFGVVVPTLCLIFDPVVFRDWLPCFAGGPLTPYATFAYTAMGLCMVVLTLWIFSAGTINIGLGWMAGILLTGAGLTTMLGIFLLPLNQLGLTLYCVGLLGVTPFLCSFVYFRNSIRILGRYRRRNPAQPISISMAAIFMGVIITLTIPALLQWQNPRVLSNFEQRAAMFGENNDCNNSGQ